MLKKKKIYKSYNNVIIGSGFSALILKKMMKNQSLIFSVLNSDNLKNENLIIRKNLNCNKFFSNYSSSIGSVNFIIKKGIFHDRLVNGGNSGVWGGHINTSSISSKIINLINKQKIVIQNLTFCKTGTESNNKNICQLQNSNGKIINSKDYLKNVQNYFIQNLIIKKKKIFLKAINLKNLKKEIFRVKKLFLCLGTVQFIDLLYRSKYIKENDIIEFSEFKHNYFVRFVKSNYLKNTNTVRYSFCRAIGHFLGIQSFNKILKFFCFIPIYIDQVFYKKKLNYKLILKGNKLIEKKTNNTLKNFGSSIHYCNMKINGEEASKYLKKLDKNIECFGMPFVNQKIPGPISNDIITDIDKKLNSMKLKKN